MPNTASRLVWCMGIAAIVILLLCTQVHAQEDSDKDQDGIPDLQDNCPYAANKDQADSDKDGIGDACDNCPYDFGPASNYGCPEKVQPTPETDSDKDGLPDSQDNCPYDYGPASNNGCPEKVQPATETDSDKDGLPDSQDNCPYDFGPASNYGCPEKVQPATETDSDKDGVPDSTDNCPTIYNPDQAGSDNDSLGDACDKCPKEAGLAGNSGCPVTTGPMLPRPVASGVIPRIAPMVTPQTTPAIPNPPGMLINVFTFPDPAGPGTSTVRARAEDLRGIGLISIFVDNLPRRDCVGVRECAAVIPDLNSRSNIGVLVFNNNNQNGVSGDVPASARVDRGMYGDDDGDGVSNYNDNCRNDRNPGQEDADQDGVGDDCDLCDTMRACSGTNGSMQTYACGNNTLTQFQTANEIYYDRLYGYVSRDGCGCKDTDGYNYFVRGSVFAEHVTTLPGFRTRCQVGSNCEPAGTDFCIDGRTLNEMTCGPAGVTNVTVTCPQGCRDGACECPDTDGGWNYYVAGDVDGNYDTCFDTYNLNEYACTYRNGIQEYSNRTIRCPFGCENGACQCSDSDGAMNYDVQGHVGIASAGAGDYCIDDRRLMEIDSQLQNNACRLINRSWTCGGRCRNGACQRPTCSDGIQNQGETNIDCGGPCLRCDLVKVNGTLFYEENETGPGGTRLKPIRGVDVGLVTDDWEKNIEDDEFPSGTMTITSDSRGHFEFIVPRNVGARYRLKFKPTNGAAVIEKDFDGCNEYVWFLTDGPVSIPTTGEADFGNVIVPKHNSPVPALPGTTYARGYWYEWRFEPFCGHDAEQFDGGSAYFNLAEDIRVARAWADGHRGDDEPITQAKVQYPDSVTTSRYNWKGEECIAGDRGFIDKSIIHEFGHQLTQDIGTMDYNTKMIFDPDHEFCTEFDEEFAMSEGFPEWYAHMIINRYRNDSQHWMSLDGTIFDQIETPYCAGQTVNMNYEAGVMATMWDLIDAPGPAYPNANAAETWDTVGGEAYEDALFKIWDIEADNLIDAPDICQLIWGTNGWKNWFRGRPEATAIDPMLRANNITNNC
jgi:hypothetical protein